MYGQNINQTYCLSSKAKWFRISFTTQDHKSFGVSLAQITRKIIKILSNT